MPKLKVQYYTAKDIGNSFLNNETPKIKGITKITQYINTELKRQISRQRVGVILKSTFTKATYFYKLTESEIKDLFDISCV